MLESEPNLDLLRKNYRETLKQKLESRTDKQAYISQGFKKYICAKSNYGYLDTKRVLYTNWFYYCWKKSHWFNEEARKVCQVCNGTFRKFKREFICDHCKLSFHVNCM